MKKSKQKKVAVAISGGVDSAVTLYLLKEQGYDVTAFHMKLFAGGGESDQMARRIARYLGVQYYPVNLAAKFKKVVLEYFIASYEKGLTPNPCVMCNRMIKFGELLRLADEIGADFLATGHYARIKREFPISNFQFPNAKLYKSKDNTKDQSYFLYTLTQDQLGRVLFPLGDKLKTDVKKIAKKAGLPHLKRESQDVCFLNQEGKIIEHNEFLRARIKPRPGKIIDLNSGKVLGKHQGLPFYTLGQRRGVEIGGTGPYYVARKDTKANTLFVVNKFDDPAIYSRELTLGDVNWISGQAPKLPLKCEAVIRYRHEQVKCEVRSKKLEVRSKKSEEYVVRFYQPQRAVTPGQSVVFYSKDEVLGGGVIAGS